MTTLQTKLMTLRKQRGITLSQLSEMTGLNRSNLSLIERGLREPGIEMFQRILEALDAELTITIRKGTE